MGAVYLLRPVALREAALTRAEHLKCVKERALAQIGAGDVKGALLTLGRDLSRHSRTRELESRVNEAIAQYANGHLTPAQAAQFIRERLW